MGNRCRCRRGGDAEGGGGGAAGPRARCPALGFACGGNQYRDRGVMSFGGGGCGGGKRRPGGGRCGGSGKGKDWGPSSPSSRRPGPALPALLRASPEPGAGGRAPAAAGSGWGGRKGAVLTERPGCSRNLRLSRPVTPAGKQRAPSAAAARPRECGQSGGRAGGGGSGSPRAGRGGPGPSFPHSAPQPPSNPVFRGSPLLPELPHRLPGIEPRTPPCSGTAAPGSRGPPGPAPAPR